MLRMVARDARYKWWADEDREYLYDLENDPLEMHNLADEPGHRGTLSHMRERMLTQLRSTQLNLSEGYIPKVKRLRAAEGSTEKSADDLGPAKAKKKKQK